MGGSSPFPCANVTLLYPLYTCDFDPNDATKLIVGGGGGPTRSGVGNKITAIDCTSKDELRVSGEVELSRDEDSVNTLVVGPHRGKATALFAGVNSSPADVAAGRNEHLRLLAIESIKSRAAGAAGAAGAGGASSARISEVSRHAAFVTSDADTYQRVMRLSAPFPGTATAQLGAVATGMAKKSQLALFDVPATGSATPKTRGCLDLPREAADLDVVQTGPDSFQLAYCNDYELWVANITKGGAVEPELVYTIPHDASSGASVGRPQFRAIRYLTPSFLLALCNLPKRTGVLIQGIRLPKGDAKARLAISTRLPRSVSQATGLAVRNLSPPDSPTSRMGDAQFVIAVASHPSSLSLYTVEHRTLQTVEVLAELRPLRTLRDVHPQYITDLAFSTFYPPAKPTSRVQHLRLASVSVGYTVVVHSIPLRKQFDKVSSSSAGTPRKGGPPRPARYVVGVSSQRPFGEAPLLLLLSGIVLILALVGQAILEMYGASPPILSAQKFLPSWHGSLRSPNSVPPDFLASLLGDVKTAPGDRIVLRGDAVSAADATPGADEVPVVQADVHDEAVHGQAKSWEDLTPKQKAAWKDKLRDAGHWAEGYGEGVFKGILFGELAGAVGRAVGG